MGRSGVGGGGGDERRGGGEEGRRGEDLFTDFTEELAIIGKFTDHFQSIYRQN